MKKRATKRPTGIERRENARALSPTEVDLLIRLWELHKRNKWSGVTVYQLEEAMGGTSIDVVRRVANNLVNSGYLISEYFTPATNRLSLVRRPFDSENKPPKTLTRYKMIRDAFVQWPRSAVFLLELFSSDTGPNGTVPIEQLRESLATKFKFTDEDFKGAFEWAVLESEPKARRPTPNYVLWYRVESTISLSHRFEREIEYLILMAGKYAEINPSATEAVRTLRKDVERIRKGCGS